MTKYARDEFDRVPETSTRQGVHRAVSLPRRRGLGPILAVGCTALVIGLVAFLLLPKLGFGSTGEAPALAGEIGTASAAPAAAAATEATTAASPGATGEAPTVPPSPQASVEEAPVEEAPAAVPAVDKTQPVAVFNGTTTAGLASRVGGTVSSAGWTLGALGNWTGARQQASVIFYNDAAQKDNAESLGLLLGIPTTVQSPEIQVPLAVVIGPGFQ